MAGNTFDMIAELNRRNSKGHLQFTSGPVIAAELKRLQDRIEVLEAEVNNAEANHIHLSNLVQELEAELEKYQKLFEAAIAGHADALMKKETK